LICTPIAVSTALFRPALLLFIARTVAAFAVDGPFGLTECWLGYGFARNGREQPLAGLSAGWIPDAVCSSTHVASMPAARGLWPFSLTNLELFRRFEARGTRTPLSPLVMRDDRLRVRPTAADPSPGLASWLAFCGMFDCWCGAFELVGSQSARAREGCNRSTDLSVMRPGQLKRAQVRFELARFRSHARDARRFHNTLARRLVRHDQAW